jgi:hypothetical protein
VRLIALLALLSGCPSNTSSGYYCETDTDCGGGQICARDMECIAPGDTRGVKATWTIGGAAADATSCAAMPNFYINFYGADPQDAFGFAPVPCMQGQFFIDKLPTRFDQVELGADGRFDLVHQVDGSGMAAFDLSP